RTATDDRGGEQPDRGDRERSQRAPCPQVRDDTPGGGAGRHQEQRGEEEGDALDSEGELARERQHDELSCQEQEGSAARRPSRAARRTPGPASATATPYGPSAGASSSTPPVCRKLPSARALAAGAYCPDQ